MLSLASSGPLANTVSLPSSAGLRVPSTGASRNTSSRSRASSASSSSQEMPTVAVCTQIWPGVSPGPAAVITSKTAGPSESMVTMMSAPRTASAGSSHRAAPSASSGSALLAVRFQARSDIPALSMFRAIPAPISPVPSNATDASDAACSVIPHLSEGRRRVAPSGLSVPRPQGAGPG